MNRTSNILMLLILTTLSIAGCDAGAFDQGGIEADTPRFGEDAFNDISQLPDIERPDEVFKFLTPEAGRDYVFVANETLDTVSKIDADTLEITSILVGDRPTALKAPPGRNMAVVLNQNSNEVSVIRADQPTENGPEDAVVNIDIEPRMNALTLSPNGRFAFAWFSYGAWEDGEPEGSLQTVSLIRTDAGAEAAFSLTTGFQIRNIAFRNLDGNPDAGASHAFVVTDTGVSIIDLDAVDGDQVLEVMPVSNRPLDDPLDREVHISPSGAWAAVRDLGAPEVYIVRLLDGAIQTISLPSSATDLDMFPADGEPSAESDRALVTVREENLILEIPLAASFDDPENGPVALEAGDLPKGLASISPDGRFVTLFTTLGGLDELTILDTTGQLPLRQIPLRKALLGLSISPDSRFALVFHPKEELTDGMTVAETIVAATPGYSIVELESGFSRLTLTPTVPGDLAFWTDESGSAAYVTLNAEDEIKAVDRINLETFDVNPLELGSPPTDIGTVLGRGRIWVNQEHPSGRMTFIEVESGDPRTVTGFELNRFVR